MMSRVVLILLSIIGHTLAVHFLPFGPDVGDTVLPVYDESSSDEIHVHVPVLFYGSKYTSLFVNQNGLVSFGTDIPFYRNVHVKDLGYPLVAIFYSDIDTQDRDNAEMSIGNISYREEVENVALISKVSKFIEIEYVDGEGFEADALFVATWDKVGHFKGKRDKRASVQLVLASNRTTTYAMLQYKTVEWVRSDGKESKNGQLDIPAQAGFVAADHRFQVLVGSATIEMNKMPELSNVNKPGLFTFRISGEMPVDPRSLKMTEEAIMEDDMTDAGDDNDQYYPEDEYEYEDEFYSIYDEYENDQLYNDCPSLPDDEDCPPASCQFRRDTNNCLQCVCNYELPLNTNSSQTGDTDGEYAFAPVDCRALKHLGHVCLEMATIRWFYSEQRDRCLAFSYKGCGGNGNNFANKEQCEDKCRPADGSVCSGSLYESSSNAQVADNCQMLTCPSGMVCRMGAFHATCCDENKERYYTQLVSPICPNGQEADTSIEAESCADEPCAASIGFQCVQVNPFFAKCCAKAVANYKANSSPSSNQPEPSPPLILLPRPEPSREVEQNHKGMSPSCDRSRGQNCDANAACIQGNGGSCCQCKQGYYGNGQLCLKKDDPQRINGRFSGVINGQRIDDTDLHTYIITSDGRAYTALSQIPGDLGSTLQFLYTIGGVMGWLFAQTEQPYSNGFQLTGGHFNRTATVHISSEHSVTIQQQFSGRHIHDYLKATVFVSGTLPVIPVGDQLQFSGSDYVEEFRKIQPGVIKSYSTQKVKVSQQTYDITTDQTINYNECQFMQSPALHHQKLRVTQSYVQYEPAEKILRYASRNVMESPSTPDGLCSGRSCDVNADCYPVPQGRSTEYECICKPGYEGDGSVCRPDRKYPQQLNPEQEPGPAACTAHEECHDKAECKYNEALRQYQCMCRPPYSGTGYQCFLEAETCDIARNCDPNADCLLVRTDVGEGYKCRCQQGFSGDGIRCTPTETQSCEIAQNCDRHADCIFERTDNGDEYRCRCKQGYTGDGYRCNQLQSPQVDCSMVNNCHPQAQCIYQPTTNSHACQCITGFTGDGYVCMDTAPTASRRRCTDNSQCHPSGQCIQMEEGQDFYCHCQYGFQGDGFSRCEPIDECAVGSDDCSNAAECLFNENQMAYLCACKQGYTGNGKTCEPMASGSSAPSPTRIYVDCRSDPDQCVQHSTCAPDYTLGGYVCRCESGFTGDPYSKCSPENLDGCVIHGNCDSNADCVYNSVNDDHECVCRNGFRGDGYSCSPSSTSCYDDRSICDVNADCLPDSAGYSCRCNQGYHGNGRNCAPDSELRGEALVFAQGMALIQRGMSPDEQGKQLVVVSRQTAVGVDYDCQEERIFWTDIAGHALRSSTLDGDNMTVVIEEQLKSPEGVAVDWISRNIYYADSMKDVIGVVSIDGMYHKVLLDNLKDPRAVEIDLQAKKLYYSDWYREAPVIGRMSLDGTDREDFVTYDIGIPNDLTLLHERKELCWADAGAEQQRLECIGVDGRGRRTVYAPLIYPFGLTAHEERTFYWTDWNDNLVHSVSINGQNYKKFKADFPGNAKPYGIVAIRRNCPKGDSPCGEESGGCPFMCLPNNRGSVSCVCPDNIDQEQCNKVEKLLVK